METSSPGTFLAYEEAKEKCNERYSCFVEVEANEHMSLSPYYIGRIKKGVQEDIERKIHRWEFLEEYQGIIVAYDSIKLLQRSAKIYDESPLLHFDIRVNYIIFKPEIGKKLVGVVNKTSSTHVGCLVHGHFNASLAQPRFCQNGWIGARLNIGTEFIFRISDLQTVQGVLLIAGQIKDKDAKYFRHSECSTLTDVSQYTFDDGNNNRKSEENNNDLNGEKSRMDELDVFQSSVEENSSGKRKKKKKAKKEPLVENETSKTNKADVSESNLENGHFSKKKSKKSKDFKSPSVSERSLEENSSEKKKKKASKKDKEFGNETCNMDKSLNDNKTNYSDKLRHRSTKTEPGSKRQRSSSPVSVKKSKKKSSELL